jgi:hypothetical protein
MVSATRLAVLVLVIAQNQAWFQFFGLNGL